jgi:ABC-type Zn uptake system ZnuABC Zn-binding protein ZnuA
MIINRKEFYYVVVVGTLFFTSFTMSYTNTTNINTNTNTTSQIIKEERDKLNVETSVAPITNIVQNIGGEKLI